MGLDARVGADVELDAAHFDDAEARQEFYTPGGVVRALLASVPNETDHDTRAVQHSSTDSSKEADRRQQGGPGGEAHPGAEGEHDSRACFELTEASGRFVSSLT